MDDEPRAPGPEGGEGASGDAANDAAHDALRRLEQRLDRASDAAERLIAQAAAQTTGAAGSQTPPSGWAAPAGEEPEHGRDIEFVAQLLRSLRELIPPELQRKLAEALRELLVAIRALIDWYLERVEQRRAAPPEVQDIPIL